MKLAYKQALLAVERDEVPVGAILVDENNTVLAQNGNRILEYSDPTAHGEILVIQEAAKLLGVPRLVGCRIYSTLEPCPMCATAISFARLDSIYFGALDSKGGGIYHGPKIFEQSTCHHRPSTINNGIMQLECGQILKDFFQAKRKYKKITS